jgi:tetratricopeptide (TPR) repeat protein
MEAMRHLLRWQLSVLLLLAGMAARAQVPNPGQSVQPSDNSLKASAKSTATGDTSTAPSTLSPGVTVSAKPLRSQLPLPKLPPDEFTNCERKLGVGSFLPAPWQISQCEFELDQEKNTVLKACYDLDGKTAPRRVIEGCTEALDHNILELPQQAFLFVGRANAYLALGDKQRALDDYSAAIKMAHLLPANERFLLFTPRADDYVALGDKQRALDDYDAAIKSDPHNAVLYYNRGVIYNAQANHDAALHDFDTALQLNSKFVPALRQRAKLFATRGNLAEALADYSVAIQLQPQTAALWSDRGEVDIGRHEYGNAMEDESRAIQLDPKLASAYYLRSVALGNSGDRAKAVADLRIAVGLEPSLASYVTISGKTVVLGLPPL